MFQNCIYPFTYLAIVFCLHWSISLDSQIHKHTISQEKKALGGKRITPGMCVQQLISRSPFGLCNSEISGAQQTLIMQPPIWSLNMPLPPHQHFSVQGPKRVFTPFQHGERTAFTRVQITDLSLHTLSYPAPCFPDMQEMSVLVYEDCQIHLATIKGKYRGAVQDRKSIRQGNSRDKELKMRMALNLKH